MHSFLPATKIESIKVNENFTDLSTGEADTDANSLALTRFDGFNNYSPDGLNLSKVTLLEGAITAGVAYIKNATSMVRLSIPAVTSRDFTASKDTYIFLSSDGAYTYTEVTLAATEPSLPANSMPIARVTTDGTEITEMVSYVTRSHKQIARAENIGASSTKLAAKYIPDHTILHIDCSMIAAGAGLNANMKFNDTTASEYACRYNVTFGGAETQQLNTTSFPVESGTTDSGQVQYTRVEVQNIANKEKNYMWRNVSQDAAGAGTITPIVDGIGKWAKTTESIDEFTYTSISAGSIANGSVIIVRGQN